MSWRGAAEAVQDQQATVDSLANLSNSGTPSSAIVSRNSQAATLAGRGPPRKVSVNSGFFRKAEDSTSPPMFTQGDPRAADPCSQVTLSVVGAGILHVHGPLKGINQIARMIHEIDRPVGQVKVGLYSIQLVLPSDQDVERAHDLIDEHVRHARVLTQRSEELFRKAFAEAAGKLNDPDSESPSHRIFCGRFYAEMEAQTIPGRDDAASLIVKSLNSLDLIGCLYLTALVEDNTRHEILSQFDKYVEQELVPLDIAYYKRLFESSHQDSWRRGMYHGCFPDCKGVLDMNKIRATVHENMKFPNIHRLLANQRCTETLNNVQAATLSLVRVARNIEDAQLELASHKADQMLLARSAAFHKVSESAAAVQRTEDYLLDRYIDQEASNIVNIREQLRASIANVDSELTQMAIAFEDDVNSQFYRRAMRNIRGAADAWKIQMEQVESTTIVTGDRTLAGVSPGQTLEFELPDRQILAKELLDNANALAIESEGIARRFTARAAAQSIGPAGTTVANSLGLTAPGSELQQLVPPEKNYSVETGNDLQITPIIQPDGKSIAYRLIYPYRTVISAPPGSNQSSRVVRHFIDTEVQTTSFEMREISRFRVGVQATRGVRGVPILEDMPLTGRLFRSRPSRATTVQETMMLADCVVYPSILSVTGTNWFDPRIKDSGNRRSMVRESIQREAEIRQEVIASTRNRVSKILEESGISVPQPSHQSVTEDSSPADFPLHLPTNPEIHHSNLKTVGGSVPESAPCDACQKIAKRGWSKADTIKR